MAERSQSFSRWQSRALDYQAALRAPNTERGYASDWHDFTDWCDGEALMPLPASAETVATYLVALEEAGAKPATIRRRLSGIAWAHERGGFTSPTADELVRRTLTSMRRAGGSASEGKAALLTEDLRRMLAATPRSTNRGVQERALLLVGFAGGFRRSELVALNLGDLTRQPEGIRIAIRRGKTDQAGRGRVIGIPRSDDTELCPVRAVEALIAAEGGRTEDPLFRRIDSGDTICAERLSDRAVARAVQRAAERVGLDPQRYGGHSLRAGLVTSAKRGGASDQSVMRQTGHHKREMIDRYTREIDLFIDNAANRAGL